MAYWPAAVFVVWILYGVLQWRRSREIMGNILRIPKRKRVTLATMCLFGGAAVLLAGLTVVFYTFQLQGWELILSCGLLGLGFVHLQTYAALLLVSLSYRIVTEPNAATSTSEEGKGKV